MDENGVSRQIVDAAVEVHRTLGPGLLESLYRKALAREFEFRGIECETEVVVSASYKGELLESAYRLDMVVSDLVIVELKVVDTLTPIHAAQLLSYLRLTGKRLGLLLNFNVQTMRQGIKRVVNGL